MTDGYREIGELDVLAYADGLLDGDPARKAAVEAYLAERPDMAERAAVYARQNEAIRRRYGFKLAEPVPERLYAILNGNRSGASKAAARVAAGAGLVVIAGVSGWLLGEVTDRNGDGPIAAFVDAVVADYRASLNDFGVGSTVASAGDNQPLSWLSRQIALDLSVPDLSARGYHLVEKRVVSTAEGSQAVRIHYESKDGRRLGLFMGLRWRKAEPMVRIEEAKGTHVAYWLDGPILYGLISERSDADLADLAAWMIRTRGTASEPTPQLTTTPDAPISRNAEPAAGVTQDTTGPTPQNSIMPVVDPAGRL